MVLLLLKLARVLGGDPIQQLLGVGARMERYPIVTSAKASCCLHIFTDRRCPDMRGIRRMDGSMIRYEVIPKCYSQERFK